MTRPARHRRTLISAVSLAALVALWETALRVGWLPSNLVPLPSQIPGVLWAEVLDGIWLDVVLSSLSHYSIGLVIGSVLGIAVGMAAALLPRFDAAHSWLARLLRPIPPLAWIPFAIIWFGVTETPPLSR